MKETIGFSEQAYRSHDIPVYYRDGKMTISSQIEACANKDAYTKENAYDLTVCLQVKQQIIEKPLTALFWAGMNAMFRHYDGFKLEHIHYTTGNSDFDYEVWVFFDDPKRNGLTIQVKLYMHKPLGEMHHS